jgi:iron(III) transport system substrate-binding protein
MKKISGLIFMSILVLALAVGCSAPLEEDAAETEALNDEVETSGEVNLYTNRHYDTDEALYEAFEEETGIKVNVVKGDSDELIERLDREGQDTQADLLITADAGRLYRAKDRELLQSIESDLLKENIPENLRDTDNEWTALTVRGRVIVYAKDRVNPSEISKYGDLANDKWQDKILVRSSSNIYNQSLFASLIALHH